MLTALSVLACSEDSLPSHLMRRSSSPPADRPRPAGASGWIGPVRSVLYVGVMSGVLYCGVTDVLMSDESIKPDSSISASTSAALISFSVCRASRRAFSTLSSTSL